jgi:uncharacterized protein (TIGR02145 family)
VVTVPTTNADKFKGGSYDGYSMANSYADSIKVTSPNGGELWTSASTRTITWTYNNVDNISIEYSLDDGITWTMLAANLPASQLSYSWTIPTTPSNTCRVRIKDISRNLQDISDAAFIIPTAYVQVTYPNGGERFGGGTGQYIEWNYADLQTIKLEYSTDNGLTWLTIGTAPAVNKYANWVVPTNVSTQILIRATDISNPVYTDKSNTVFSSYNIPTINLDKYKGGSFDGYSMYSFFDSYVQIKKPNGGEIWGNGTTQQIKWAKLNNNENIILDYTTDNEATWTTLLNNVPDTPNVYNWTINAPVSNFCKVRARTVSGTLLDKSDDFFTIANPNGLVTNAITGTSFCSGATATVNFSLNTTFNSGNRFIVQLSDSVGTFNGSVINIGEVTATTPQAINVTFPARYYSSSLYRLHVIGTNPPTIGTDNGTNFTINPLPYVNIGNDTILCTGTSITLNATNTSSTYLWSNGATTPTISVSSAGTYRVEVTNSCGTSLDTIIVSGVSQPSVNLGVDTSICINSSLALNAGTNATGYLWSTGATSQIINVVTPGSYSVAVSNICGTKRDTIVITNKQSFILDLGADRAICSGQTIILNAGNVGLTYLWSTGQTTQTINVTQPGIYWVNVSDVCQIVSDQINIINGAFNVSIGGTLSVCNGTATTLTATGGNSYYWNTSATTSSINVAPIASTTYSVTSTNYYGCTSTAQATVTVKDLPTAQISIVSGTTTFCSGDSVVLTANSGVGYSYQWYKDGVMISNATGIRYTTYAAGSFTVKVTNSGGCSILSAAFVIVVNALPTASITASGPTSFCSGNNVVLSANVSSGLTYQWQLNGNIITGAVSANYQATATGNYRVRITSTINNCIAYSNVISVYVTASTTSTQIVSACSSYTWNGITYTESGNYQKTFTNAAGCDSIATLNLTINTSTASSTDFTACNTYNWNGTDYTTSGVYTFTTQNANGCDSVATLNLTIKLASSSYINISVCSDQLPYLWNGINCNSENTYNVTLSNYLGCDSIATLILSVISPVNTAVHIAECNNYNWNGQTYTTTGTYTQISPAVPDFSKVTIGSQVWTNSNLNVARYRNGDLIPQVTDSSIWANLNTGAWCWYRYDSATYAEKYGKLYNWYAVNDPRGLAPAGWHVPNIYEWNKLIKYLNVNSDTSGSYENGDIVLYASGVGGALKETGTSNWESPNTGATNITGFTALPAGINDIYGFSFSGIDFEKTMASFWSSTLWVENIFSYHVQLSSNIDALIRTYSQPQVGMSIRLVQDSILSVCNNVDTLYLTILDSTSSILNIASCDSYFWNGQSYTQSGVYTFASQNANGCDSVATLNLTIKLPTASNTNISVCNNQLPYIWNGINCNTSGTYNKTLINAAGCDSIATLTLTLKQTSSSTNILSACASYSWNGNTYTSSGTYTYRTTNAVGCDSTAILNLTIKSTSSSITNISECTSYTWNGNTYSSSGTYTYHTTNASGCDSLATLNLTIKSTSSSITNISECTSYTWNGNTYTSSGTYTYHTTNASGCDSLATLNLTIKSTSSSTTNISECTSYSWNGNTYTSSGTYTYHTTNAVGCDSIATLVLTITTATTNTSSLSVCGSYLWPVNGQAYESSGRYTSISNCIEEVLNLIITPNTSNTTTASSCDSYTWLINGQAYTQSGNYQVVNGCHTEALNLTITPSTSNTTTASSCDTYTWSVNSQAYAQSGIYTSITGCHIEILNLTITPRTSNITTASACSSYLWSANGQTYSAGGNYTYINGCNIQYLALTINTNSVAPTAATASSTTVGSGTSVTLNVSGGSLGTAASWKWYSGTCGGTLVGTGASISVAPTVTTTYYVRAEGTCNTTTCAAVTVTVQSTTTCGPTAVVSNAIGNAVCSGRSVLLTVQGTLGSGASWKWYKGGCGSGTSIGTGASITVTPTCNTTYYVLSMGGTCGTTTCKSITISVATVPSTPGTISGNLSGVCNTSGVGYSIVAVSGATSYAWTVPTGATIVSGQGTTAIVVNYGASIGTNSACGSTSVCVKAANACGSSANKCLSISITPPTASCGTIVGPSTACTSINATYSCSAVAGATAYNWVVPTGWTIISGQGTISLVIKPGTTQGTVKVTPSNSCGSGTASSKRVKATSCTTPVYTKGAVDVPVETIKDISIWPNPANNYFNLSYVGSKPDKIELFDVTGKLIFTSGWKSMINVSRYNSGFYYLRIYTGGLTETKKLEVIK